MDRNTYLNKCKECAMIADGGLDVPERLQVEYRGARYYPTAYQLSFRNDGAVIHTAILHDLTENSVVYALLDDVK